MEGGSLPLDLCLTTLDQIWRGREEMLQFFEIILGCSMGLMDPRGYPWVTRTPGRVLGLNLDWWPVEVV
jgi:hypothetical protein